MNPLLEFHTYVSKWYVPLRKTEEWTRVTNNLKMSSKYYINNFQFSLTPIPNKQPHKNYNPPTPKQTRRLQKHRKQKFNFKYKIIYFNTNSEKCIRPIGWRQIIWFPPLVTSLIQFLSVETRKVFDSTATELWNECNEHTHKDNNQ